MCNIAGYAGNRQAAPILLEMLRKQQAYDGGMSTGIATIHEGKIHWRKVIGDVDTLINETDALSLPGTVGIAHSRPGGSKELSEWAHPFISMDGEMALVTNGTSRINQYAPQRTETVRMLEANGYKFLTELNRVDPSSPSLKNGHPVSGAEARLHVVDYFYKQGKSLEEAMALCGTHYIADNVWVMINKNTPDSIYSFRITRPMHILLDGDESYIATTGYAFPEDKRDKRIQLPLDHTCIINKGSYTVTKYTANIEPVCEVTPYAYAEAYRRFVEMLSGKKDNPLHFDDLEFAAYDMRDIWPKQQTYVQDARLVYDILDQLDVEGRLHSEIRPHPQGDDIRYRYFFWLD